jgi:phage baseplate assembly protein W
MVDLLAKRQLTTCDMNRSIAQNLHLILTSQYGSYSFDKDFGCAIWDLEYENVVINQVFKDALTHTLVKCIEKYEPRLSNIDVVLDFKVEELPARSGKFEKKRVKRKFEIKVSGELILTKEMFNFSHKVYLSPFSYN